MEKRRKETKNAEKKKEKENFIKKIFPDCNSSPGGTFELKKKKLTITPARKRRVEKMLEKGECSESKPAKIVLNFNKTTKHALNSNFPKVKSSITSFGLPTQTDQRSDVESQPITGGGMGQGKIL